MRTSFDLFDQTKSLGFSNENTSTNNTIFFFSSTILKEQSSFVYYYTFVFPRTGRASAS